MKNRLVLNLLFLGGTVGAFAGSCGTIAAPGSCVLNADNQVQYVFSNFNFVSGTATGTQPITAADIQLNLVSGGGLSAVLEFDKTPTRANPNVVFLANSGESNHFVFSYDVAITALAPGTVQFVDPATVTINQRSATANGAGTVQFVIPSAPVCQANTTVALSANCSLTPGTTTSLLGIGDIVKLSGNSGNVSIGIFSNVFNARFTPEAGVPEPATFALFGFGLIAVYFLRRP